MTEIRAVFFSILFCSWLVAPNTASAFSNNPINVTVKPNGKVNLRNFYLYTLGPCRAFPAPAVTSQGEKLGTVSVVKSQKKMEPNPCNSDFEYEVSTPVYQAGSISGKDEFTLYVHDGARFHNIKTTVTISGNTQNINENTVATKKQEPGKKQKVSTAEKGSILIVTLSAKEEECKNFNDTFQFDVAKNIISEQKVNLAAKQWISSGRIDETKIFLLLEAKGDQLSITGGGDMKKYEGRWISKACSGSFSANVTE